MSNAKNYPAFPVSIGSHDGHQDSTLTWQYPGISIRDYFAASCPITFECANDYNMSGDNPMAFYAAMRYEYADAMLAEREK